MPKRTIMRSLTIKELSGVDRPAQVGAKVTIMKRDDSGDDVKKEWTPEKVADLMKRGKAVLTTATDGHTHLVMLEDFDGNSVVSGTTTWQDEHTHPWIMQDDGTILIGTVDDHDHEPDKESKLASGETAMTKEEQAAADALKAENDALKAKTEKADKVIALSAVSKAHYDTLTEESDQDTFLAKSADDQDSEVTAIEKAKTDSDPVVYTTTAGHELRKSDGLALIEMAKQNDLQAKENADLKKKLESQDLRKRAETDLEFLPGTIETRMAMLKSINAIKDETERGLALEALKAQNKSMSEAFETYGKNGNGVIVNEDSAEGQLDAMAKKIHAENPKITAEAAYAKAMDTKEGAALYAKAQN